MHANSSIIPLGCIVERRNVPATVLLTSSIIIGGVFFTTDKLFRVKQLPVRPLSDLVHHTRFKVNEHCSGHVFARTRLGEERVERVISIPCESKETSTKKVFKISVFSLIQVDFENYGP